jgi:hypothetical protein
MNGSKLIIVVVMIVALLSASLVRQVPTAAQRAAAGGTNVSQLDSFALGLLLGGLRGPLVMMLWSSSESQKSERELEDFDTKVELIRLLQPEFDAVHLFQIWNKAYNISVQMANLSSKYSTIIDAIEYAERTQQERPDNINIESAIASIYFDKLGNSAEKLYYQQRVRDDTMARQDSVRISFPESRRHEFAAAAIRAGAMPGSYTLRPEAEGDRLYTTLRASIADYVRPRFTGTDVQFEIIPRVEPSASTAGRMRTQLDPMLDEAGMILPHLLSSAIPDDVDPTEWRPQDGDLAFLRRFQPFKFGISAHALGYNYFKRAIALQVSRGQRHAQLSERVTSSRAPLALRFWAEEELARARRLEIALLDRPLPPDEGDIGELEAPSASAPLAGIEQTPALDQVLYGLRRSAEVAAIANEEFDAHIQRESGDRALYASGQAWLNALQPLVQADHLFLEIASGRRTDRTAAKREAASLYSTAIERLSRTALQFYITDELAREVFPPGFTRPDLTDRFPSELLQPTFDLARVRANESFMGGIEELEELYRYVNRARTRLSILQSSDSN